MLWFKSLDEKIEKVDNELKDFGFEKEIDNDQRLMYSRRLGETHSKSYCP